MNLFSQAVGKVLMPLALTTTIIGTAAVYDSKKEAINSAVDTLKTQVVTLRGELDKANLNIREANDTSYVLNARAQTVINNLNAEIERLNSELAKANSEVDRLGSDLTAANTKIDAGKVELDKANSAITLANDEQTAIKEHVDAAVTENADYVATTKAKDFTGATLILQDFTQGGVEVTRCNDNDATTIDPIRVYNKTNVDVVVTVDGKTVTVPTGKLTYFNLSPKTWTFQLSANNQTWNKVVNNLQ